MTVEVGVRESSEKELEMSIWSGHMENWEVKNWQREYRCPENGGKMEAKEKRKVRGRKKQWKRKSWLTHP